MDTSLELHFSSAIPFGNGDETRLDPRAISEKVGVRQERFRMSKARRSARRHSTPNAGRARPGTTRTSANQRLRKRYEANFLMPRARYEPLNVFLNSRLAASFVAMSPEPSRFSTTRRGWNGNSFCRFLCRFLCVNRHTAAPCNCGVRSICCPTTIISGARSPGARGQKG